MLFYVILKTQKLETPRIPEFLGKKPNGCYKGYGRGTHGNNGTIIMPDLIIEQLHFDRNGKEHTVKDFKVRIQNIREDGFFISGSNHSEGDAILAKTAESAMVSRFHLAIGHDDKGFFAVDKGSSNHTYLLSKDRKTVNRVNGFDITDGTIACLGTGQWIRFKIPSAMRNPFVPNGNSAGSVSSEARTVRYGTNTAVPTFGPLKRNPS